MNVTMFIALSNTRFFVMDRSAKRTMILRMEEVLHQLIDDFFHSITISPIKSHLSIVFQRCSQSCSMGFKKIHPNPPVFSSSLFQVIRTFRRFSMAPAAWARPRRRRTSPRRVPRCRCGSCCGWTSRCGWDCNEAKEKWEKKNMGE